MLRCGKRRVRCEIILHANFSVWRSALDTNRRPESSTLTVVAADNKIDDGGANSGAAFVFLGAGVLSATVDASEADMILVGADADGQFGAN